MIATNETTLFANTALLPGGWSSDVSITYDTTGSITAVSSGQSYDGASMHKVAGPLLPGIPNLHSHAHQRAMAGLSEYRTSDAGSQDSFWTWRKVMHAFAPAVTPEMLEVIATQLYIEMLKAGYTSVCEFHYLHHQSDGGPYDDPAEMAHAIVRAARSAGIGLTLLPVLYSRGGYADAEPNAGQGRFISNTETMGRILAGLFEAYAEDSDLIIGLAPHSPRQVSKRAMTDTLNALDGLDARAPIHIHVAEQLKDVEESIAFDGVRPVEWMFQNFDVDERWCLVHATHIDDGEIAAIADSRAVVGVCPTTEANLGDGIFPLIEYLHAGGRWGVGSDSNVSVSPVEELRWLEYGQRLTQRKRNLVADGAGGSTGRRLFDLSIAGGAQASGRDTGRIAPGYAADFLALDGDSPWLAGRNDERIVDSFIFAGNDNLVGDVWVGGRHLIVDGRHRLEASARDGFNTLMAAIDL